MRIKRAIVAGAVLAATLGSGTAWATPELSTKDQLKTRRYVAAGDRAYVMGFQDGRFYAQGWHVSGEMGGVWTQPLKLVDGVWFAVDGKWLDPATKFSSGWGYTRMDFPDASGLQISRTDFAPDGKRAALFGLRLRNPGAAKTVDIAVDAHSELMSHYPWTWTDAERGRLQRRRHRRVHRSLARVPRHRQRDVRPARLGRGRGLEPQAGRRRDRRRPLGLAVRRGAVHRREPVLLRRGPVRQGHRRPAPLHVKVPAHGEKTLWVGVAGSDKGTAGARSELDGTLASPARALADKIASRERLARQHEAVAAGRPAAREGHRVGQAEHRRPHAARGRPERALHRRGQGVSAAARAPSRTRAGSARATRTTRGSSPPTPSTRRSRR